MRPTILLYGCNRRRKARILANPHITYIETADGGHCAFMGEPNGDGDDGRWAEREVVDFARHMGERDRSSELRQS